MLTQQSMYKPWHERHEYLPKNIHTHAQVIWKLIKEHPRYVSRGGGFDTFLGCVKKMQQKS